MPWNHQSPSLASIQGKTSRTYRMARNKKQNLGFSALELQNKLLGAEGFSLLLLDIGERSSSSIYAAGGLFQPLEKRPGYYQIMSIIQELPNIKLPCHTIALSHDFIHAAVPLYDQFPPLQHTSSNSIDSQSQGHRLRMPQAPQPDEQHDRSWKVPGDCNPLTEQLLQTETTNVAARAIPAIAVTATATPTCHRLLPTAVVPQLPPPQPIERSDQPQTTMDSTQPSPQPQSLTGTLLSPGLNNEDLPKGSSAPTRQSSQKRLITEWKVKGSHRPLAATSSETIDDRWLTATYMRGCSPATNNVKQGPTEGGVIASVTGTKWPLSPMRIDTS
ncbi:hypothetical protein M5K25_009981 [Dendrobium thyrsiflorum]|uniref:Uncharacterized protein n=1 Tax=Dendrobium thyrsiflorum TaxID=117978 RepID=A0ABD0VDX4_DENTH